MKHARWYKNNEQMHGKYKQHLFESMYVPL
jgi:hypothetical protein